MTVKRPLLLVPGLICLVGLALGTLGTIIYFFAMEKTVPHQKCCQRYPASCHVMCTAVLISLDPATLPPPPHWDT